MNQTDCTAGIDGKRICVLVNSLAGGGAEKVVVTLFPEYLKAGVQGSLLCLEENNFYHMDGISPVLLSSQTGSGEGAFRKLASLFGFALKLKKYVSRNQVDLVQSHIYRANYVNVLARLLGAKHKIQIVNHGMPGQYRNEGLTGKINRFLIRRLYPKADQVICPSRGMIDQFIALGVPQEKLQLIRNPCDLECLQSQANHAMAQGEFEFDPQKKYLISIGRLQAAKRVEDVVMAFYQLQKEEDSVELIILGEGEKRDSIAALVKQLTIGKKVHMQGQVKNPHKYLARSDVLVSASAFEGFSNVIVEALVAGIPVISTDCESGPREILAPGTRRAQPIAPGNVEKAAYGLLVAVGDVQALVNGMQQLLNDAELRQQLAHAGAERAGRFDKASIAHDYLECSRAILTG